MQMKLASSLIKNCKEEPYLDHLMRYHILNSYGPLPLMTRPKGYRRCVILDLSYGENLVNNAMDRGQFDGDDFKLTLPSLDNLLPFIEHAFRNVPVDPRDSIHMGMKWKNKYYVEKSLAFGAVHRTGIFFKELQTLLGSF